jgi:hypothetical protein
MEMGLHSWLDPTTPGWLASSLIGPAEGVLTCVESSLLYFLITDFPEEATFLTDAERKFVKDRLIEDVGDSGRNTEMTAKDVFNVFKDYKVFVGGFMYFGLIVPAYGYAYFAPSIIRQLGYSS